MPDSPRIEPVENPLLRTLNSLDDYRVDGEKTIEEDIRDLLRQAERKADGNG